jgi:CheY-like chemotaxis protein/anti-anti-sigma regulatory factor
VLIVDDEPDFLGMAEEMLTGHGFALRTAIDPERALAALEVEPADVVLVDLQMPKGGGRRLLREARTRFPGLYAIVVTAYGSEKVAVELLNELGACDYIAKTDFDEFEVVKAIERALRTKRADALRAGRGFEILVGAVEGVTVVEPLGFLTAEPRLRRLGLLAATVDAARERGERVLLVDLAHLAAVVPLAFGLLLGAARRLERAGGRIALCSPPRSIAETLELFDRALRGPRGLAIHGDRAAALAELRAGAPATERVH